MLYWHKFNFEKSMEDLANFTPLPGRNASHNFCTFQANLI